MLKNIQKAETQENRASGMEGLAVAVIETAINDLKTANSHSQTAVHFLKNCPELLEFWLAVATQGGRTGTDLEVAKKTLFLKAQEAEKTMAQKVSVISQQKEIKRLLKRAEKRKLSPAEEKHLQELQKWATSKIAEHQRLEKESKIATHLSKDPILYKANFQHLK